ncbi:MAG: ATP-binding cassette domain-containing protein, partial [Candidatus Dormibacteraeota bacterium]|nr:ATP-binding cassette domain-containing protein [Candidatus Dormibacteraeota bacterium]MBO0762098.1 ATP-binding cassette domain-containing protein [Candidatus Dormibacteraeota bacterium]
MLRADVALQLGRLDLEIELAVEAGQVVTLLGPNGAGKTTLLRALAGLLPIARGRVALDGAVLEDTEAGRRLQAEQRPVGMVFQDYLLFPHLSILDNVAFGLLARGASRREARQLAEGWLDRLGLGALRDTRPAAASGGQ